MALKDLNKLRNKVIDRLNKNRQDTFKFMNGIKKELDRGEAQRRQRLFDNKHFRAEATIDKLNDKLGYERGDYTKK